MMSMREKLYKYDTYLVTMVFYKIRTRSTGQRVIKADNTNGRKKILTYVPE